MKFLFKKFLKKKSQASKGGAILDQVFAESAAPDSKCLLYKLANYKGGGDLIDAMQTGGQIAVENLIREQFGVFMYNGGRGQIINRAEYLRWKYKDNTEVTIPIEASLSSHDPLSKWVDHKACWQMQYRGSLGESLIHVLIICDTKVHTKLARLLLRVFPEQSIDIMEGEEYLGASALHLAIAYSNNELVCDLVDAGADINQRAIGRFFLPRDQQGNKPAKNTDYEGLAYLGEYPLAWAACCSNESVYNLLLDNGADPDAQDNFGNMILHMVVVCDKLDMFGYALRHPKFPCKNGIVNLAGLTPLTLACKLGRAEVFKEMLELSAREFWRYSNITCSAYPLNALDTISPDGSTNWQSALFIILDGTKQEHLDMLDGGIIQKLLEEKWETFAQRQFSKRLLILFVHLFFLSCSVSLRQPRNPHVDEEESEKKDTAWTEGFRYFCECTTVLGVLNYVIFQQGDELKNQGLKAFLKSLKTAPPKAVFLVSNILILACIPFRLMGDIETEEALLIFAVPGSWFLLMFFAGAIRLTGPFVTMIFSMITGDMFTFAIIYFIMLFGFSNAFYFLYKGHPEVEETGYSTYMGTWMAMFQMTLGDYDYSELNDLKYANTAKTVFIIFMIFVPILLLNMLIAMMGNTYAAVIEQSEKEFVKQWAKIVVSLERAVPKEDAQRYLETYSIPLGPEERGVMVIKSKSKTRARQRKGAVGNWKRVLKVTLGELKKKSMTGEELRRIMWGRASITSPTKISKKKQRELQKLNEDPFGLTAALDQMSYTHDIMMLGDEEEEIMIDPMKKKPVGGTLVTDTMSKSGDNMTGLMQNLKDSAVPTHSIPSTASHTPKSLSYSGGIELHGTGYRDPLKMLINLAEDNETEQENEQMSNQLYKLAEEATLLDHIEEVHEVVSLSAVQKAEKAMAETQAAILFQNPKDIVDPVKEAEFLKTLAALVESDSDPEKPVLGKGSLIRRAKSAVARKSSTKKRKTDEHPLFMIAWDEQPLQGSGIFNFAFDDLKTPLDDTMADVNDQDYDEATVADEVIEPDPPSRKSDVQSESSSVKSKTKRRKRFGRNKVSPTSSEEGEVKDPRRVKTAPPRESGQDGDVSPPDPLEPWSTKDIMNINQLLDQNDSPLVGDEPVPAPAPAEEEEAEVEADAEE